MMWRFWIGMSGRLYEDFETTLDGEPGYGGCLYRRSWNELEESVVDEEVYTNDPRLILLAVLSYPGNV